jgi:hypothetical protein
MQLSNAYTLRRVYSAAASHRNFVIANSFEDDREQFRSSYFFEQYISQICTDLLKKAADSHLLLFKREQQKSRKFINH